MQHNSILIDEQVKNALDTKRAQLADNVVKSYNNAIRQLLGMTLNVAKSGSSKIKKQQYKFTGLYDMEVGQRLVFDNQYGKIGKSLGVSVARLRRTKGWVMHMMPTDDTSNHLLVIRKA